MKNIDQIRNSLKLAGEMIERDVEDPKQFAIMSIMLQASLDLADLYENLDNAMYRVMNPNP